MSDLHQIAVEAVEKIREYSQGLCGNPERLAAIILSALEQAYNEGVLRRKINELDEINIAMEKLEKRLLQGELWTVEPYISALSGLDWPGLSYIRAGNKTIGPLHTGVAKATVAAHNASIGATTDQDRKDFETFSHIVPTKKEGDATCPDTLTQQEKPGSNAAPHVQSVGSGEVKNAVECGICGASADRLESMFRCTRNPSHVAELITGLFTGAIEKEGDAACQSEKDFPIVSNAAPPVQSAGSGEDTKRLYYELIYAVESKWPDESRHETALRYIQEHERRFTEATDAAMSRHDERKEK